MIIYGKFSTQYSVRRIAEADLSQVLNLCRGNPLFYQYCPPFATKESILADMKKLPKGKSIKDKYYVGFFDNDKLIAVMDLIDKFPNENTAFIGFFMVDILAQHKGNGSKIIKELCQYLKAAGYEYIRLGWVKGNYQSEAFWHKNCFLETGVSYNTDGYTVVVAQRKL